MTGHHDAGRPHPVAEWIEQAERSHSEETAERLEMDRATAAPPLIPFSWAGLKELGYVVGVVLGLAGGYYGLKSDGQHLEAIIEALAVRVTNIEVDRREKVHALEQEVRLNMEQATEIKALLEGSVNLRRSIDDVAAAQREQDKRAGDTRETVARLEERIGRGVPHDR